MLQNDFKFFLSSLILHFFIFILFKLNFLNHSESYTARPISSPVVIQFENRNRSTLPAGRVAKNLGDHPFKSQAQSLDSLPSAPVEGSVQNSFLSHYLMNVRSKIENELQNSIFSKMSFRGGESRIRISLNKDGSIAALGLVFSSGNRDADEVAIRAIQKSAPFPALDQSLITKEVLTFVVPVRFQSK